MIPLIKPSDAVAWSKCARRVWLDNKGNFELIEPEDAFDQLVKTLGEEHEHAILRSLEEKYTVRRGESVVNTQQLMRDGIDVI